MINLDKDTLNNYINSFNNKGLINYISEKLNIHSERLSIVLIDKFETEKLTIDKTNQFVIILNNSEHETVIINDTTFDEVLCIDTINDIIINSNKINFSELTFIVFNDNCKQAINTPEVLNKYNIDSSLNIILVEDPFILSEDDCDYFVKIIDNYIENDDSLNHTWFPGNNVNCKTFRIDEKLNNTNLFLNKEIYKRVNRVFNNLEKYINKKYAINAKGNSGYQFRKIFGPTRMHKDGVYDTSTPATLDVTRIASIVICLNDDYEGGEFCFPIQDITVKLKKGQIIVFPPYWTHPHYTMDLKNRTYRYTINSWLHEDFNKRNKL
tara:strand:- start:1125 stop:2096 length:972 start_codon:yes stop_codon:yes gene_type:complete